MKITASRVKELIKEEIEKFLLEEKFDFSGQSYKSVAKATRSALRKKGIKGGSVLSGLKKLSYNDPLRKAYRKWYSNRGKTPTVTDPKTKKRTAVQKVPSGAPTAAEKAKKAAAKKEKDAKFAARKAQFEKDQADAKKKQNLGTGVAKKPRKVEKVPTPRATTAAQRAAAKKKKDAAKKTAADRIAKFKAEEAAAKKKAAAAKKKKDGETKVTNLESLQKKIEALVREALK